MQLCKWCFKQPAGPDGYCYDCGAELYERWKDDRDAEEGARLAEQCRACGEPCDEPGNMHYACGDEIPF